MAFARRLRNEGNDSRRKRSLRESTASPKSDVAAAAETGGDSNEETIRGENTGERGEDVFDMGVAPLLIALKGSSIISGTAGEGG